VLRLDALPVWAVVVIVVHVPVLGRVLGRVGVVGRNLRHWSLLACKPAQALMAFASALSNCFTSKCRSASRSLSAAARVLAVIGFRFFAAQRFVGTAEL